ncbi:unnamed protein product, partial [Darwinula stevensoni]
VNKNQYPFSYALGVIAATRPKLQTFWKYAKVELRPPSPSEIPQIKREIQNLLVAAKERRWKQLTVQEAWLNTLVTLEVVFCFFIGECLGKRHFVGYEV